MPVDGSNSQAYSFGMGKKLFASIGKEARGDFSKIKPLAEVIKQVEAIESSWDIIDTVQPLSKVHIDFTGGGNGSMPIFQFRSKSSLGKPCHITRHALSQLSAHMPLTTSTGRSVTPMASTEARCLLDENQRKLETMAWSYMLDQIHKEVMFRSKVIDGIRTITSVQGVGYAPILDSLLLKQVNFDEANVTQFKIGSDFSNYMIVDGEVKLNDPTTMLELNNSDGGKKALQALLKAFVLLCTNGMMGWDTRNSFSARHFGDRERIMEAFNRALDDMQPETEFLELYQRSREVELDNTWGTFLYRSGLSKEESANVQTAMNARHLIASPQNSLGSIIDAMTLSAQAKSTDSERLRIESRATDFLIKAMDDWENERELVPNSYLEALI